MGDDIVDRILSERREKEERRSIEQRAALARQSAVEENSPFLWREILNSTRSLVAKYNFKTGANIQFGCDSGSAPRDFRVEREVFPIAGLTVWKHSPHFFEFQMSRTEASFTPKRETQGRFEIKADDDRNIYFVCETSVLHSPQDVAEYLLKPVLG